MKNNGITDTAIRSRMKDGWSKHRIIHQTKDMTREEYDVWVAHKKKTQEKERQKRLIKQYREKREAKKREHLTKYPQAVKPSDYYHNLLNFALKPFREIS